jgi:hypothetical protein
VIVLLPAVLAAVLAVVLAVAGQAGDWVVVAAGALCVVSLGVGWGDLLRLPYRQGTAVLVSGLGVAGLAGGTMALHSDSDPDRSLGVFVAILAAAVLTSFAHELARPDGRHELVESVTGTLSGQIVAVLASGWVLLEHLEAGPSALVIAAAAVATARIGGALPIPLPEPLAVWATLVFGLVGAVVASMLVSGVRPLTAGLVGLAVAGMGLALDRLFPLAGTRPELAVLARAAAPVAAAGTVAYAIFRIGLG